MDQKPWSYSFNADDYYSIFETREQTILEALREYDRRFGITDQELGDTFTIGELELFEPVVDADQVIEELITQAWEEAGDCSAGYLCDLPISETTELEKRLQSAFDEWAKETKHEPDFYVVKNIEVLTIDQARCIAANALIDNLQHCQNTASESNGKNDGENEESPDESGEAIQGASVR